MVLGVLRLMCIMTSSPRDAACWARVKCYESMLSRCRARLIPGGGLDILSIARGHTPTCDGTKTRSDDAGKAASRKRWHLV